MKYEKKYYINCDDMMYKGKKGVCVPKLYKYGEVLNTRLTLNDLKVLKKACNIKGVYNKKELAIILYNTMRIHYSLGVIIRSYRNYKLKKYELLLGLENEYVNTEDFESLESLSLMDKHDLMGVREEGKVYGFDIVSFENLLLKYKENAFNPYTRTLLDADARRRFKEIIYLKRLFKYGTRIKREKAKDTIESRLENVFYKINELGNYADSCWVQELTKERLIKFMYELADIWEYRANLSQQSKRRIYAHLNPFSDLRMSRLPIDTMEVLQQKVIKIIERFISSEEQEHASLGAFYVLGAITLVNNNAAEALPWLYQSFYHANA